MPDDETQAETTTAEPIKVSEGGTGSAVAKQDKPPPAAKPPALAPESDTDAPTSRAYYAQAKIERAGFEAKIASLEQKRGDLDDLYTAKVNDLTDQRNAAIAKVQREIDDAQISWHMAMDKIAAYEQHTATRGAAT